MIARGATVAEPYQRQANDTRHERDNAADEALDQIREALRGLRFGSVNIIVQDGVVIQIDRTEKRRLRTNSRNHPPSSA